MPPGLWSRFALSLGLVDEDEAFFLTERVPYTFKDLPDNTTHTVVEGDTVFNLAARRFAGLPRPAGLFWVICDFQPDPIFDPTVRLVPGSFVILPSRRTVEDDIFSQARASEQ